MKSIFKISIFVLVFLLPVKIYPQEDSAKEQYQQQYKNAKNNYRSSLDSSLFYVTRRSQIPLRKFPHLWGKMLLLESKIKLKKNRPKEAVVIVDKVIDALPNDTIAAKAYTLKSNIFRALGNYNESIELQKISYPYILSCGDTLSLINYFNGLGILYEELDLLDSSIFYYLQCLDVSHEIDDDEIGYTYSNLAIVFSKLGDIARAKSYTKKSISENKKHRKTAAYIGSISRYAGIMLDQDMLDSASFHYNLGIQLAKEHNYTRQLASNYLNLGYIKMKVNKFEEAIEIFKNGQKYAVGTRRESKYLLFLAEAYNKTKRFSKAEENIQRIRREFKASITPSDRTSIINIEKNIALAKNDYKRAYELQEEVVELKDSIYNVNKNKAILDTEAKWQNEKKTLENNTLIANNKLKNLTITKRNNVILAAAALIMSLFLSLYFLGKKNKKIEKQNQTIKTLNAEITHRVKNQFVLATELLKRQRTRAESTEMRSLAEESENHLRAVAAVNKRLEASGDFKKVDLADVLNEIIENLHFSYGEIKGKRIRLHKNFERVIIDQSKATYLGLILNELFTNSVKHAFADISAPIISANLRSSGKELVFEYTDNGDFQQSTHGGKGTSLVDNMIHQLDGQVIKSTSNKMHYKIQFSHE